MKRTKREDEEIAVEIEEGPPTPEQVAAYERFMAYYRTHVINSVASQSLSDEELTDKGIAEN